MTEITKEQKAALDTLLKGYKAPKDILGENGLLKELTKRLVEQALQAEMTEHLGYEPHSKIQKQHNNNRNGYIDKTVHSDFGVLEIEVPRDREGTFEPQLVKKRHRRIEGFDDKVIALYSNGLTTREIQNTLEELYGAEVSPTLISQITDAVMDEVHSWQSRPLDRIYAVIYFDALFVKSRQDGTVKNRAVYLALGVNTKGEKELLGIWLSETEGSKFWLSVFTELKNRGIQDSLIACVDGLTGLPDAIETVFPQCQVQLCIVHKVRNSLKYVSWKDRKAVAADLRAVYGAATLRDAEKELKVFGERWDAKYPAIRLSWEKDWERLTPQFEYPTELRKIIYTTNAIESLNYSMRKILKNRGAFPNDEAVMKLLYLGIQKISKKWTLAIRDWKPALNQLVIMFGERLN